MRVEYRRVEEFVCAFPDIVFLVEIFAYSLPISALPFSLQSDCVSQFVPLNFVVKAKYDLSTLSIASCVEHVAESISSSSVTHVHISIPDPDLPRHELLNAMIG
jgi:hypothetical protein